MRSYRIVNPNLRKRKKFPPENFPQVRHRYIFLNFQNFQEGRDVKIANGKITLCAESGTAFTDFCKCPGGLRLHSTLQSHICCNFFLLSVNMQPKSWLQYIQKKKLLGEISITAISLHNLLCAPPQTATKLRQNLAFLLRK